MVNNRNSNQNIEKFFLIISLFGLIYIFLFNENSNYNNLYFLPLGYFVFSSFMLFLINKQRKTNQYKSGIAYNAAITLIFIRYVITPITVIYTGNYSSFGMNANKSNLDLAILLMLIELLMIKITMNFARYHYSNKCNKNNYQENTLKPKLQRLPLNITLIIFMLVSFIIIIIFNYHLLLPQNMFLIDNDYIALSSEDDLSGGLFVLANLFKTIFLLVGISLLKYQYDKKKKSRYILLSFFISILYMGTMTSTKRWDMLFSAILCMFVLNHLYKKLPKLIFVSIISVMFVSIISISMYKFSWSINGSLSPIHDILLFLLQGFQAYFSGPLNVAQSIGMKEAFSSRITIVTFINDFLGSIPILSNWINQSDRINVYFNLYNNMPNTSQIISMVGIGYSYFPLLPPIFSMICEWYVVKLDYCIQNNNCIEFKFIYLNLALYLAMCMGFNTQIVFSAFIIRFLPLYILFSLNRKIVLTIKSKNS